MTNAEFLAVLQKEVDTTINFRQNEGNKDICGIYWGDIFTETAIPSGDINEERTPTYCDNFGYPHRGSNEARARVENFINRFNNEEDFRKDVLGIEDEI